MKVWSSSAARAGCAGIVNALFYADNCDLVYGDLQTERIRMIEAVRGLGLPVAA